MKKGTTKAEKKLRKKLGMSKGQLLTTSDGRFKVLKSFDKTPLWLEKGKTYVLKVRESSVTEAGLFYLQREFQNRQLDVIIVSVFEINDIKFAEKDKNEKKSL